MFLHMFFHLGLTLLSSSTEPANKRKVLDTSNREAIARRLLCDVISNDGVSISPDTPLRRHERENLIVDHHHISITIASTHGRNP